MKKLTVFSLLAIFLAVGCSLIEINPLVGSWELTTEDGATLIILESDGTFILASDYTYFAGTYSNDSESLTMSAEGEDIPTMTYVISGNNLELFIDGGNLLAFARVDTSIERPLVGSWLGTLGGEISTSFTFESDGGCSLFYGGYDLLFQGTYTYDSNTIVFSVDNTFGVSPAEFLYALEWFLGVAENPITYEYFILGNRLVLSHPGSIYGATIYLWQE